MRILLHGGGERGPTHTEGAEVFYHRIAEAARTASGRVLMVHFGAPEKEEWAHHVVDLFYQVDNRIEVEMAREDRFAAQLVAHDVVFFQGGGSKDLCEKLLQLITPDALKGKALLAGTSAGAMALCAYGYSHGGACLVKGMGIVPQSVLPHADVWPVDTYIPLLQAAADMPVLLLAERTQVEMDVRG